MKLFLAAIGHTRWLVCGAQPALFAVAAFVLATPGAKAQEAAAELPADIERALEVEPLPPVVVDPTGRYALLVHERQLLSIEQLSEPAVELAGHSISLRTGAAHAPLGYYGLTLVDLHTLAETPIPVPYDSVVGYPQWSADGSRFAFTLTRAEGTELMVGEAATGSARRIALSVDTARGLPCHWLADNHRLLCRFSPRRGRAPAFDSVLDRLAAQAVPGEPATLSASQAANLLETQLAIVDSVSGGRHDIGAPTAFESVTPAPGQAFLLVTRLLKPYPQITGLDLAPRVTEVWDRFGNIVAELPTSARAIEWRASSAATLIWIERRDGADHLISLRAPFNSIPRERFALPHRFAGIRWLENSPAALVNDYDPGRRRTELWLLGFDSDETPARTVTTYTSESGQLPVLRRDARGFERVVVYGGGFYLRGTETRGKEHATFLDLVSLDTGARKRVWRSDDDPQRSLVDVLSRDATVLLTRREAADAPPNYFLSSTTQDVSLPLTRFEGSSGPLTAASRIPLQYRRDDGLQLAASLYLPPGYDGRAPLPAIVWAYPRQISKDEAATLAADEESSMSFSRAFRLFYLLRGYAVLDDVSMPIVGDESDANDTFVEQIVANAAAAIAAAQATGFVDPRRVGVAGHSYGAFMVANLLVHSRLFGAGVALSGAYNRTLTPFGFQTERRTLWQAQQTYLAMSPLLFSDRIEAPLLLVHGLKDNNAGTSPQQSLQFYRAIRGNGGNADLLLLPWEGHSYRSRESVRKTAAAMLDWFNEYLKPKSAAE